VLRHMAPFFGDSQFAMDTHRKKYHKQLYYIYAY
jgi:hypothetical protein